MVGWGRVGKGGKRNGRKDILTTTNITDRSVTFLVHLTNGAEAGTNVRGSRALC